VTCFSWKRLPLKEPGPSSFSPVRFRAFPFPFHLLSSCLPSDFHLGRPPPPSRVTISLTEAAFLAPCPRGCFLWRLPDVFSKSPKTVGCFSSPNPRCSTPCARGYRGSTAIQQTLENWLLLFFFLLFSSRLIHFFVTSCPRNHAPAPTKDLLV